VALDRHLSAMKITSKVATWSTLSLGPGEDSDARLHRELSLADAVLILLSSDYVANDGCWKRQFQQVADKAISGTPLLISIRVRPVDIIGTLIDRLPCLPATGPAISQWQDQDAAWTCVAEQLRTILDGDKSTTSQHVRDATLRPQRTPTSAPVTATRSSRTRRSLGYAIVAVSALAGVAASMRALLWHSNETPSVLPPAASGSVSINLPISVEVLPPPASATSSITQSGIPPTTTSRTPIATSTHPQSTVSAKVNALPPALRCDTEDEVRACRAGCRELRIQAVARCTEDSCRIQAAEFEENSCVPSCKAKGCTQ
jgi:hypothetical protein